MSKMKVEAMPTAANSVFPIVPTKAVSVIDTIGSDSPDIIEGIASLLMLLKEGVEEFFTFCEYASYFFRRNSKHYQSAIRGL